MQMHAYFTVATTAMKKKNHNLYSQRKKINYNNLENTNTFNILMQAISLFSQIQSPQVCIIKPIHVASLNDSANFMEKSNIINTLQIPVPELFGPSSTKSHTSTQILSSSKSNKNTFKGEFDMQKIFTHSRRQSSTTSHQTKITKGLSMYSFICEDQNLKQQLLNMKKQNEQLRNQIEILKKLMIKQSKFQQQIRDLKRQKEILVKDNEIAVKNYIELCKKSQKQYNLYKEITEKLERRVQILLLQNKQLKQSLQKNSRKMKQAAIIQSKLNNLKKQSQRFQNQLKQQNQQWQLFKVIWKNQKQYYKQVIRKLEFQLRLKQQN